MKKTYFRATDLLLSAAVAAGQGKAQEAAKALFAASKDPSFKSAVAYLNDLQQAAVAESTRPVDSQQATARALTQLIKAAQEQEDQGQQDQGDQEFQDDQEQQDQGGQDDQGDELAELDDELDIGIDDGEDEQGDEQVASMVRARMERAQRNRSMRK